LKNKLKVLERKQSKRILKSKYTHKKLGKNFYKTQIKVKKINKKIKNRRDNRIHLNNVVLAEKLIIIYNYKIENIFVIVV